MMTFTEFARLHGLILPEHFGPRDRVQRCATVDHPRSRDGAFLWDGRRGWVSDWANGAEIHWYDDQDAKGWTDEQRRAWSRQKRARELAAEREYQAAAERAAAMLDHTECATHFYLNAKGLPHVLGLVDGPRLLVPMRHVHTNALQGVQVIEWVTEEQRYVKKMNYGSRAKGAVLRLGNPAAAETYLCEGYATGLSIELAIRQLHLNAAVLICFSDSNLAHVASMTSGRRFVVADHDKSGAGLRAALKTGLPYCMSPMEGEDANDLHQRAGLMALCSLLMEVRRQ